MWGIVTPQEAKDIIQLQIADLNITEPKNLEEQALSLVGRDVYEKLIKGYTEKQWGRDCKDLPALSSNVCRYVLLMTTIILMTAIGESRSVDTQPSLKKC